MTFNLKTNKVRFFKKILSSLFLLEVTCYLIRSRATPKIVKVITDHDSTRAHGSDFVPKVFLKKCKFIDLKIIMMVFVNIG